jgi:hypothetical protein
VAFSSSGSSSSSFLFYASSSSYLFIVSFAFSVSSHLVSSSVSYSYSFHPPSSLHRPFPSIIFLFLLVPLQSPPYTHSFYFCYFLPSSYLSLSLSVLNFLLVYVCYGLRCFRGSRNSSVDVVTRLQAGRPRTLGSIPGRGKRCFSSP